MAAILCPLALFFGGKKKRSHFFFGFFPVFSSLLQVYANQIFASILKPAFVITAVAVGMTLIVLKILSKYLAWNSKSSNFLLDGNGETAIFPC